MSTLQQLWLWRFMKRFFRLSGAAAVVFAAGCFVNNTNMFIAPSGAPPTLLAHRGLAQTYHREGLTGATCTAARIDPPEHPYVENTIASMHAAFSAGADIVEFDIHPTTDGAFAVFHDWTLECRTEGRGVTREHSLAALKELDIGYGYTADGGKTFPFRGRGVGLMPTLDEVLAGFPDRRFLINVKSNDANEGIILADRLAQIPAAQRVRLMVYGGDNPLQAVRARLPDVPVMSRRTLKDCALRFLLVGWSGYVPETCRHTLLVLPSNAAPFAWGWPHKFIARMRAAGTAVFITGEYDGSDGTSGVDRAEQYRALPAGYDGGIWTNRIDRIAPLVRTCAK
jgi:glycerophosphoryl diester phosphodiesterase